MNNIAKKVRQHWTKLRSSGKEALFPDAITTKVKNNNGKCGTGSILTNGRTQRSGRVTIPYRIIISNNINTIDKLNGFIDGLVVLLINNDYFELQEKNDELSRYLLENIGGNNIVSSIICICSVKGDSGSSVAKFYLDKFLPIFEENKWRPVERIEVKANGLITSGNEKWSGHYYYDVSGGSQERHLSHHGKKPQLFNEYHDYATREECFNIDCVMLYMMLHCYDINDYIHSDTVSEMINDFEEYFATQNYDDGNILNNEIIPYCLFNDETLNKKILHCPIECERISIHDFEITDTKKHKYIDICHNEAVSRELFYYDETQNRILTAARARNLYWGSHNGNMMQQDLTIKDFIMAEERRYNKRKNIVLK